MEDTKLEYGLIKIGILGIIMTLTLSFLALGALNTESYTREYRSMPEYVVLN